MMDHRRRCGLRSQSQQPRFFPRTSQKSSGGYSNRSSSNPVMFTNSRWSKAAGRPQRPEQNWGRPLPEGFGGPRPEAHVRFIASATVPNPSRDPHSSPLSFRLPQWCVLASGLNGTTTCRFSAIITPIRASIVEPPVSARRMSASMAHCHSGARCSAAGNCMM